ncbi:MAG TPA: CotH kinase family protein, partial [Candidatus Limnocylindria bacterium]|nr:CotH kinase family protein [Candidatus Limnocylindria bacterium]
MPECFRLPTVRLSRPLATNRRHRVSPRSSSRTSLLLLALSAWILGAAAEALPPPRFDHQRGLYFEPFTLTLSAKGKGTYLRFTTDGSLPGPTNGTGYFEPLRVTTTTILRVAAFGEGKDPSAVETRSFIFPREVFRQNGSSFPTNWGVNLGQPVPASYAVSPAVMASAEQQAGLAEALRALPTLSLVLDPQDLFGAEHGLYAHSQESGEDWERAASLEFLPVDGTAGFHHGCGVRMQGGWSRRPEESPKHSLRIVFRKRYGPGQLKEPVFGEGPARFDTLILRGGNNNTWLHPSSEERRRADYLRDPWMRATYAAMGHAAARDRFVHLYLNGLYWGIYDLCERPDEHFAAAHLGG